ncbi:chromosome partitioning protein ParB, partial [Vibrio furnissii]
ELKPTQPSVGYDQIYYKLGRYQHDAEKQFDEICEANGQ